MAGRRNRSQRFRNISSVVLILLLLVFGTIKSAPAAAPARPVRRVLLFYSSNLRAPYTGIEDEVIRERLSNFSQLVEVFSDNLDPSLGAEFYRRKYRNVHFDVIVTDRDEALSFVLSHRDEIFGKSPVVFHTMNRENKTLAALQPGYVGVEIDVSLLPSLNLIRQLQPDTRRVVVILGADPSEVRFMKSSQSQTAPFAAQVPVDFWTGMTPDELRNKLGRVSPHTAVLYMSVQQDREGRQLVSRNVLAEIAPYSKAPIYSIFSTNLGLGTVGGRLIDAPVEGGLAADLIERILNGEDPELLRNQIVPPKYAFDARELKRFGIEESRLPAGSEILLREPSAWERYRSYILGSFLFLLVQAALIVVLFIQRRRARQAKTLLERCFAIETIISDCSNKVSECPAERVDEEIQVSLQAVLQAEGVDRTSWFVIDDTGSKAQQIYSAHRAGVSPEVVFYGRPELPWVTKFLVRDEPVALEQLDHLPPEAQTDRLFFEREWVKSVALIPSRSGSTARGLLVLVSMTGERTWPLTLIDRLGVLGNIFAGALMRKQAQESGQESEQKFRYLITEAPIGIALEDFEGKLLFTNPTLCTMLGYSMEELNGMNFSQLALIEDEGEDRKRSQAMRAGVIPGYQVEKQYRRKDGVLIWGRLNVSFLRGSPGSSVVLATVEDITEKKLALEDLTRAHSALQQMTPRLLQAQEEERERIARELHDDIGQRLSLLMGDLEALKDDLPLAERAQIHSFHSQLVELAIDVHNMSHQLHSAKLRHLGLGIALRDLCHQLSSRSQTEINLVVDQVMPPLAERVSLCFYRVAQEALTNALKHSGSPLIQVRLTNLKPIVRLEIKDFGVGFDPKVQGSGLGLATMHERLQMLGGQLSVNSSLAGGTQLVALANVEQSSESAKIA